jgi:hypothetical protein
MEGGALGRNDGPKRVENPKPGDRVVLRWHGWWRPGVIVGEGTGSRLPVQLTNGDPTIYWRSRRELFVSSSPSPQ